ncbi:ribosome recycling factor [Candidatus Daviesbacteria bacterium]|nr:ribosome recycling factor [Candidatus Daviesbacteria bacterium]
MDPNLQEANTKIQAAIDHLKHELAAIRAGRANPTLIEDIPVSVYGSRMKLLEVGTIASPQPSLLTVQVWDVSIVEDVKKAIHEANIGLHPAVDGQVIRLPIPALTEERREEFVKLAHQKGEICRVEIRQIRGESREKWERAKSEKEFGEDELYRRQDLLQELVDKSAAQVEELVKAKEEELRQI